MMPSTCSIRSLERCHAERHPGRIIKTSFSRSNPGMRGQATSTRTHVRQGQAPEQHAILQAPGSPPVRINLLFTINAEQASAKNRCELLLLPRQGLSSPGAKRRKAKGPDCARTNNGGAERDRTADLRSAIAALSQLSYGPIFSSE